MFGFSALLNKNNLIFRSDGNGNRVMQNGDYLCFNNMIDKFADDKVFYEDTEYMCILDGVVLNKKNIQTCDSWPKTLIDLYKSSGEQSLFFDKLRGSFGGVFFDKKARKYYVFSDHIGSKFLYYVQCGESLFVSSMISECYAFLKQNNIPYQLSVDNAYLLLTYGYMLEDRTLCDQIKKLEPGCYLTFEKGQVKQRSYCLLDNTPDLTITEEGALEILDAGFRKAIQMQFDKDEEYGYKHLVALSAGLDSRMVSWVAHEMGYTRQINATFSQSDYWDQKVPMQIASDLKHEWVFKSLDGGWWLQDVDAISRITGGNVQYYGLAHGRSLTSFLNYAQIGITHSGQLGDVVFSSFYNGTNPQAPYQFGQKAYSTTFLKKAKDRIELHNSYQNEEIGNYYYRGFAGANNGLLCNYEYNEVISPFQDIDLLQAALHIPLNIRHGHELYFKWILTRYPEAAKYVWEKLGGRIDRKFGIINVHGHKIRLETVPKRVLNKLFKNKSGLDNKQNMNPIGYYLQTNDELRDWMDKYIADNVKRVSDKELYGDILTMVKKNNTIDKIEIITLLSALKLFFE
jgi:asparagine synthase (glutamine-hydrolysing)